jgi:phosphopentomutase
MPRALVIVLDSVGCGQAPDAEEYGDLGANTLGHLYERIPDFHLPHLESIGLAALLNLPNPPQPLPGFTATRLTSHAAGKDTTSGHWELMGYMLTSPFDTFTSFPDDLVDELSQRCHTGFLGNTTASGTEIITRLGPAHLETGKPILYTSADSVMQIAAHEESFGLTRLWDVCQTARTLLNERNIRIGRVIARPFTGNPATGFHRTPNRHDYSIIPGETSLNLLQTSGITTIGIGKISDIFAHSGIDQSHPTKSNAEGMATIDHLWNDPPTPDDHFLFANLVDFDALYGHRRDPSGYADCLRAFDTWLGTFLPRILPNDLVLITADHGNDPCHTGTDHTREQVPLLAHGAPDATQATRFSSVARIVERHFSI